MNKYKIACDDDL